MKSRECALVVGGGAFGTCAANVLAENFQRVVLKVRSRELKEALARGENSVYLPGLPVAANLIPVLEWEEVNELVGSAPALIVSGLPSSALSAFYSANKDHFSRWLAAGTPLVSLSKGISAEELKLSDDIFFEIWPQHRESFVFLSGPSFAREIMQKQITLVTLAGESKSVVRSVCDMFETDYFRALPSRDIKGTLLGGALKNVIAIAGGIIEGLGYNDNTRAALITWGIAEMTRFGRALGAKPETFYGPSGMGDLILTAGGGGSRNKRFGLQLARGRTPREIMDSMGGVVEGYETTRAAWRLSERYDIDAPLFKGVYQVVREGADPRGVIAGLVRLRI